MFKMSLSVITVLRCNSLFTLSLCQLFIILYNLAVIYKFNTMYSIQMLHVYRCNVGYIGTDTSRHNNCQVNQIREGCEKSSNGGIELGPRLLSSKVGGYIGGGWLLYIIGW